MSPMWESGGNAVPPPCPCPPQVVVIRPGSRLETLVLQEEPLPHNFPFAFVLKTQGMLLHGHDLAARLPDQTLQPRLLHTLRNDLARAQKGVATGRPVQALVWIAKRTLRAAFELCDLAGFSRDLAVCCRTFGHQFPEHAEKAETVLEHCVRGLAYLNAGHFHEPNRNLKSKPDSDARVGLIDGPVPQQSPSPTPIWALSLKPDPPTAQIGTMQAMADVAQLVAVLEDMYLSKYFHPFDFATQAQLRLRALPVPSVDPTDLALSPERNPDTHSNADRFEWGQRIKGTVASLLLPWSTRFPQYALPQLPAAYDTAAAVRTFDWSVVTSRQQALECIRRNSEPVLLRRVMNPEFRVRAQDLATIQRCRVRVSPSQTVVYCEEGHPLYATSALEPPSRVVALSGAVFVRHCRGELPRLFSDPEYYYMQSPWPFPLQQLRLPPLPYDVGSHRLWASCAGLVSTLHFDYSPSVLGQV